MNKTIAFFGHRKLYNNTKVRKRLIDILKEITPNGYSKFLVGRHGEFDNIALNCCIEYKKMIDKNIDITIVLTTLNELKKDNFGNYKLDYYVNKGCQTMIYDIEEEYFKNRIIVSNRQMVDDCDLIICYVNMNENKSDAKKAIKYAIKQGKNIINLYNEQDSPFFNLSEDEINQKIEKQ